MPVARTFLIALAMLACVGVAACEKKESAPPRKPTVTVDASAPRTAPDAAPQATPVDAAPVAIDAGRHSKTPPKTTPDAGTGADTGGGNGSGGGTGTGTGGGIGNGGADPCAALLCKKPYKCVTYYGVAGPKGPEFASCEVRCKGDADCPKGT